MKMRLNKFKNMDYKIKLYLFYGSAVFFICYFMYDIYSITTLLSNLQFNNQYLGNEVFNTLIKQSLTLDYNLTIGGAMRSIALDIIQINFLIMFMLVLYIHEVNNDRTK